MMSDLIMSDLIMSDLIMSDLIMSDLIMSDKFAEVYMCRNGISTQVREVNHITNWLFIYIKKNNSSTKRFCCMLLITCINVLHI